MITPAAAVLALLGALAIEVALRLRARHRPLPVVEVHLADGTVLRGALRRRHPEIHLDNPEYVDGPRPTGMVPRATAIIAARRVRSVEASQRDLGRAAHTR